MLDAFVDEFFDQNPISQLGIIITRDKRAERVLDLTGLYIVTYLYAKYCLGNVSKHHAALSRLRDAQCIGEPSLQNSLKLAISRLKCVFIELLVIYLLFQRCSFAQQS